MYNGLTVPKSESLLYSGTTWMADDETEKCLNPKCNAKFTLLKKKHHCRSCGRIFCDNCAPLVAVANGTPWLRVNRSSVRRCNSCRLPPIFTARRWRGPDSPYEFRPMEIILSFLDDRSISRLHTSCATMLRNFLVPKVSFYASLQERLPTLFSGAQVGKGAYGTVYKVEDWKNNNEKVAVKVINKGAVFSYYSWKKLFAEIEILEGNDHVNVARLLEVFQTPTELAVVMELGGGGSLKRAFETVRRRRYNVEVFTANVVGQVAAGLDYLYRNRKIVHRDIKHENIVLSSDYSRVMIIDFGLAEYVRCEESQRYVPCGTMGFASPENIKAVVDKKLHFEATGFTMHEADLFSLGVVAFAMLSGSRPLKGTRFFEQHNQVLAGLRCVGPRWIGVSEDAKRLIEWLLQGPTHLRATCEDVVQHRWVIESIHQFSVIEEDRNTELDMLDRAEENDWVFVATHLHVSEEWRLVEEEDVEGDECHMDS